MKSTAMPVSMPEYLPLYGSLQQPSLIDFPGKLSLVFFSSGCNFTCRYCHNAFLLGKSQKGLASSLFKQKVLQAKKNDWVNGITFSGGEPSLHKELLAAIAWCHAQGLSIKLDTNGSNPDFLMAALPYLDYIAMDVKCSLQGYPWLTGYANTTAIEKSLSILKQWQGSYELRTTVVESFHTEQELQAMQPLITGAKTFILQPFHPREELPDPEFTKLPATTVAYLEKHIDLFTPHAQVCLARGSQQ